MRATTTGESAPSQTEDDGSSGGDRASVHATTTGANARERERAPIENGLQRGGESPIESADAEVPNERQTEGRRPRSKANGGSRRTPRERSCATEKRDRSLPG